MQHFLSNIQAPIDWFDPAFYNSLSVKLRARYKLSSVALPLPEHITSWEAIKQIKALDRAAFMEHHGNAVAAQSNYSTADEIAAMEAAEVDDSNFESNDDLPDDMLDE